MAAGPANFLGVDLTGQYLYGWQLLKPPLAAAGAETAISAARLSQNIRDVSFAQDSLYFLDVSGLAAIELGYWGTITSDNDSATTHLYGWSDTGPGRRIGTITPIFSSTVSSAASTGWHAKNGATHKSITDAFTKTTAYVNADTYTETADYDNSIVVPATLDADLPSTFIVSFANTRYRWFGITATTYTTVGNVLTLGAVFRSLGERAMVPFGT